MDGLLISFVQDLRQLFCPVQDPESMHHGIRCLEQAHALNFDGNRFHVKIAHNPGEDVWI